jgi:hypothetical protein
MSINGKFVPPKIAITRGMIEAGKQELDMLTAEDAPEASDDQLVAQIFYAMWETYWREIENVKRSKEPGRLVKAKPALILPRPH